MMHKNIVKLFPPIIQNPEQGSASVYAWSRVAGDSASRVSRDASASERAVE